MLIDEGLFVGSKTEEVTGVVGQSTYGSGSGDLVIW
jgi:hypothetical protein